MNCGILVKHLDTQFYFTAEESNRLSVHLADYFVIVVSRHTAVHKTPTMITYVDCDTGHDIDQTTGGTAMT